MSSQKTAMPKAGETEARSHKFSKSSTEVTESQTIRVSLAATVAVRYEEAGL